MLDFTLDKYLLLCETISRSSYTPLTFEQYFSQKDTPENFILLRHDVETDIKLALKMAEIEHKCNIVSTYYCRKTEKVFKPEFMMKIADLGHEIGYHYETLDKAKGNVPEAIQIFKRELLAFREFVDVRTACMHGNPFSSWSNRDMWDSYDLKDLDITGEPYLSIDYDRVAYLTDTGRTWADKNIRVKDVVEESGANKLLNGKISTTDDIIDLIKNESVPQICILAHPDRWHDNIAEWMMELITQNIKNIGKAGIIMYRNLNSQK